MQRSNRLLLSPLRAGTLIEAEQAETKGGVIESSIKGYTGAGYVRFDKAGSSISFTYDAPAAGDYLLEFRYVLEEVKDGGSDSAIQINDAPAGKINFWTTGGPSSWAWDRKTVRLKSGKNSITLQSTDNGPKLDHLNVLRP